MFQNLGLEPKYKCENPILLNQVNIGIGQPRVTRIVERLSDGRARMSKIDRRTGEEKPITKLVYDQVQSVPLIVRCGKCAHCRKLQNDQWFLRCCNHLQVNKHKYIYPLFVTFTFSPDWWKWLVYKCDLLPDGDGKVDYRPIYNYVFQSMKKRLRAERGENLTFDYVCVSEFGEKRNRFHFHAIFYFYDLDADYYLSRDAWLNSVIPSGSYCAGRSFGDVCRHRIINKKLDVNRLQSDDEVYLQSILEKHFSEVFGKRVRDGVPHVRKGKNGRNSVFFNGQFGYVTSFSSFGFGSFHYILGYTMKCLKDGVSTFRRQSPAIGRAYAELHKEEIYDGLLNMIPCGYNKEDGSTYKYPIPRYYLRLYGDHEKLVDYTLRCSVPQAIDFMNRFFDNSSKVVEFDDTFINLPFKRSSYVQSLSR